MQPMAAQVRAGSKVVGTEGGNDDPKTKVKVKLGYRPPKSALLQTLLAPEAGSTAKTQFKHLATQLSRPYICSHAVGQLLRFDLH